jgi:TRAP transporter TAXI family solute receptor
MVYSSETREQGQGKMSRHVQSVSIVGAVIFASLFLGSCSQEAPVLSIGSGGSLGNYYSAARAIARIVNERQDDHEFRLKEIQTTGSVANIDAILAGEIAFGIAQADREYQAVNGLADWKDGGPQTDLRAVFSLYTDSITVVATRDSGIRSIQDLIGRHVDIGHPGSGVRQNAVDVLDATGAEWRRDTYVYGETPGDRASLYLRGDLDAFFHTVGHPTQDIVFAVNSVPGARLIPLANTEKLLLEHPYYSRSVIPIGLYPGLVNEIEDGNDVETLGIKTIFLTSVQVPDEVVYFITRAVFDDIQQLGRHDPVMKSLSRASMVEGMTAPVHPGASRYYEEVGLELAP